MVLNEQSKRVEKKSRELKATTVIRAKQNHTPDLMLFEIHQLTPEGNGIVAFLLATTKKQNSK